jgi:protein-S-isoprenylcysteine O-methyltransferase Ste14
MDLIGISESRQSRLDCAGRSSRASQGGVPVTRIVRVLGFVAALAAVLFLAAGRLRLPWFWAFLGVHAALLAVQQATLDADLRKERRAPGPGGVDRALRPVALPLYLGHLIVAGLDAGRFHWSGPIPWFVHAAGLAGYACGLGLAVWAMAVNRFFSPVARLQCERGHSLVTAGPYRALRHPGYAGGLLAMLSSGLALGSWWSLLPLLPVALLTLRRTVLEDRLLQAALEGYGPYVQRVPSRLVPGIW